VGHPWSGHQEFASLVPPDGAAYLHVQSIGGPPRVHLDLLGDVDRDTTRLEELGATRGPTRDWWQVMSSPAGLPFCLCDERWPHHRPGAASLPDGHRSRVVQLCVDVPVDHYDAELAFWRQAASPRPGQRRAVGDE
jgi:hypothetical protein